MPAYPGAFRNRERLPAISTSEENRRANGRSARFERRHAIGQNPWRDAELDDLLGELGGVGPPGRQPARAHRFLHPPRHAGRTAADTGLAQRAAVTGWLTRDLHTPTEGRHLAAQEHASLAGVQGGAARQNLAVVGIANW